MNTLFIKSKEGKLLRFDYRQTNSRDLEEFYNPVKGFDNGKLVYLSKQDIPEIDNPNCISDWDSFFKSELAKTHEGERVGTIRVKAPNLRDIFNNSYLNKFVRIENEGGFDHFRLDKPLVEQEMDSFLSYVLEEYRDDYLGKNATASGGYPVDPETNLMSDILEINVELPDYQNEDEFKERFKYIKDRIEDEFGEGETGKGFVCDYDINIVYDFDRMDLDTDRLLLLFNNDNYMTQALRINNDNGYEPELEVIDFSKLSPDEKFDFDHLALLYIPKSDRGLQRMLEEYPEPQVKLLWMHYFDDLVKDFNNYSHGNAWDVSCYELNEVGEWDEYNGYNGLLKEDIESYIQKDSDMGNYGTVISSDEANSLHKGYILESFKKEVVKLLPEFDNNAEHAFRSAYLTLQKTADSEISKTIFDYLKENGCDSNEKSAEFIKSFVTGKSVKELEKEEALDFHKEGVDCYWSMIKNPNRSDNYGVSRALLVDNKNKTFAAFKGVSYMVSRPSETYLNKVTRLPSDKKLNEKIALLAAHGYKNVKGPEHLEDYRIKDKEVENFMNKYDFGR